MIKLRVLSIKSVIIEAAARNGGALSYLFKIMLTEEPFDQTKLSESEQTQCLKGFGRTVD